MKIPVEAADRFVVSADWAITFELLADVPRSVSHFPDLEKLQDEGDGCYRWLLKPLGAAGISHQVIYACRYVANAQQRTIIWTPVPGIGNGVIKGQWRLIENRQGTTVEFNTSGELDIAVPMLFRAAAKPVVQGLFQNQVKGYLKNIQKALSQSAG
jgi:hypothetical protein